MCYAFFMSFRLDPTIAGERERSHGIEMDSVTSNYLLKQTYIERQPSVIACIRNNDGMGVRPVGGTNVSPFVK